MSRPGEVWSKQARSLMETARMREAARATRISPSAMAEVLSALGGYWADIETSDLSGGDFSLVECPSCGERFAPRAKTQ
jgi:hypothetical protein